MVEKLNSFSKRPKARGLTWASSLSLGLTQEVKSGSHKYNY